MKIKNTVFSGGQVASINKVLQQDLPVLTSYKLAKLSKELVTKAEVYDTARMALLKKLGTEDKEKGVYEFGKGKQEQFQKEFNELLQIEEDYDFETINLDLADVEGVKLSALDLNNLELFINFKD